MLEHQDKATSWELDNVKKKGKMPKVKVTRFDMCEFDMGAKKDEKGREVRVMKPTKVMSNSEEVEEAWSTM